MKVVLVGYGRMGRKIELALNARGHQVIRRIDNNCQDADTAVLNQDALKGADGVIEFALAVGLMERMEVYASSGLPVVVGTTGWNDGLDEARGIIESAGGALLYGSNFSLGAHLFFRLTRAAARLVNSAEEYDVALVEYHHNRKADYPSGTALTAAQGVLAELDRKNHIIKDLPKGPIPVDGLQVASVRMGQVPGIHEMRIDSLEDHLAIRHEARSSGGFALGAVRGLEWLSIRRGWHDADEFIDDLLTGKGG